MNAAEALVNVKIQIHFLQGQRCKIYRGGATFQPSFINI